MIFKTFFGVIFSLSLGGLLLAASPALAYSYHFGTAAYQGIGSTSYNWSGYVVSSGTFTGVSGSWNVSAAQTPAANTAEATWIGVGGINRQDLIQVGTQTIINGQGQVRYEAFYETLPSTSVTIPVTVNAGDFVAASLNQESPGEWNISFEDVTDGQTYQTQLAYQSSLSSVEWIEEMPTNGNSGQLIALNNFGTRKFSGAMAVENGSSVNLSQANAQALSMVTANGQSLVSVSPIGSDGASFQVTRTSVTSNTIGIPSGTGVGRGTWRGMGRRVITFSSWPSSFNYSFAFSRARNARFMMGF